jgi:hypothetical protein
MSVFTTVPDLALVIASTGREQILLSTVRSVLLRKHVPEQIILVGATEGDIPFVQSDRTEIVSLRSPVKGASHQRNFGIRNIREGIRFVSFLDDDCEVHDAYFLEVARCFSNNTNLAAFSGYVMRNGNIEREVGREILDSHVIPEGMPAYGFLKDKWPGLYGCAMNFRYKHLVREEFDENLVKYSLGEDTEIGFRMRRYGDVGGSARCPVVHLACSGGRGSEVKLGYSQIANYYYFVRKGIGYPKRKFISQNLLGLPITNFIGILRESSRGPHTVDRKGRLKGNLLAIYDLLRGKIHPSRIDQL